MTEGLDKLTGAIGDTLKTAPTLYEDALQSTTQESGKVLAIIPRAINAALVPLRQWIAEREFKLAETEKLLAQKLEHVGEDKIVTPEAYVAVPALQAISYSMDSEELRNLYANLLAKAMNSDTKDMVHPSFVEIIKQLSPIDSLVLKNIMERKFNPLIDLVFEEQKPGHLFPLSSIALDTNVSDINIAPTKIISVSIDNLIKQGLISIPNGISYADKKIYDNILNSQFYLEMQQYYHSVIPDGYTFTHTKKRINITNLGVSFHNICMVSLQ